VTVIKLASNENPYGPSPRAVTAMQAAVAKSNFYPDDDAGELCQRLANKYGLSSEQTLVGAGSTELLNIICRTLLRPGLNAVTSRLSFIAYLIATQAAGGLLTEVPMVESGFDLNGLAAAITPDTRIAFLANPNNPTGTAFDASRLDTFLSQVPQHVTVVVDEAYYDFAQHRAKKCGIEYSHALDYVREGRNVVVLRTFSKAHGLAGIRVGYGFGPPALIARLARMRTTFSISVPAQAGALAAMDDEDHVQKTVENNAAGIEWLTRELCGMGYAVAPSWANFLYCDVGQDAASLGKRLKAEGILIRPLNPWGAPTAIRVTIGTPQQNEKFLAALTEVTGRR
jgi:histidinol-phosphate aminotransferase